jgi:large subunit ribosomal protein L21
MYAIFVDGGRQYKVSEGQTLDLDYRDVPSGETLTLDRVLCVSNGSSVKLGAPNVEGAVVSAEVIGPQKGDKIYIQKFRRRKNFRRRTGHRQLYTRVRISKIEGI